MNTKEAIKFLEDENIYRHFNAMDVTQKKFDKYNKSKRQVISLLQQGEKYRQMWEELEYALTDKDDYNIYSWSPKAREIMKDIEQKYFPKEETNEIKSGI